MEYNSTRLLGISRRYTTISTHLVDSIALNGFQTLWRYREEIVVRKDGHGTSLLAQCILGSRGFNHEHSRVRTDARCAMIDMPSSNSLQSMVANDTVNTSW